MSGVVNCININYALKQWSHQKINKKHKLMKIKQGITQRMPLRFLEAMSLSWVQMVPVWDYTSNKNSLSFVELNSPGPAPLIFIIAFPPSSVKSLSLSYRILYQQI